MSILIADIVQLISQFSPQVYCTLRLVSTEVKEMVDEVLPVGKQTFKEWRVKFLQNADLCRFKLLEQRQFEHWIDAIFEDNGDTLEKFCRDYLPKDGFIEGNILGKLCKCNRKEYVRELWNEALDKIFDKNDRFYSDCIQEICMLDDFEFVKLVYDYFQHDISVHVIRIAIKRAMICFRWKNLRYLVEMYPELLQETVSLWKHTFSHYRCQWDLFQRVNSCQDKEFLMELLKNNGLLLQFAHESLLKDKEVVMTAMKHDEFEFCMGYADDSLRKDKDFVMEAIQLNKRVIEFVDKSLRKDKDVVMKAVKGDGMLLRFAHESLRKDKEVVLEAVKQDGAALEFTDESLRNDKELVLEAVKQDIQAMKFVDESLRKDKEAVLEFVKVSGWALQFADEPLQNDKRIVMEAVKQTGWTLSFASKSLRKDKDVVIQAIKQQGYTLKFADESLRKDKDFVMQAVTLNGDSLQCVDSSLRKDKDVVLAAVKQDGLSLRHADKSLRIDHEIVMEAVKQNKQAQKYASQEIFTNDKNSIFKRIGLTWA